MIKDPAYFQRFEDKVSSSLDLTIEQALALVDAMWEEGTVLGVLPPNDPLEGIDLDIKLAKVLNSCLKSF